MIIYEVNCLVDKDISEAFQEWLPGHVREILKLDGFISAETFQIQEDGQLSARGNSIGISVRYYLKDDNALNNYLDHHAERLRQRRHRSVCRSIYSLSASPVEECLTWPANTYARKPVMDHTTMSKNDSAPSRLKILFMISIGGMLEAYDFIIYGLMIAYIGPLFFPSEEVQQSLFIAFTIFAIGYLSRPLGGLIFGHQGDRHGRKKPLTTTLLLMATATVAIGLLPDYHSIGLWAPALLISLRFIQGLSMGGEVGGVYTYISEVFERKKALAIAIIASGMELGILLGQGCSCFLGNRCLESRICRLLAGASHFYWAECLA